MMKPDKPTKPVTFMGVPVEPGPTRSLLRAIDDATLRYDIQITPSGGMVIEDRKCPEKK